MNLQRMMFWKSSAAMHPETDNNETVEPTHDTFPFPGATDNVISLPMPQGIEPPIPEARVEPVAAAQAARSQHGLLDAAELKSFFDASHFGHGRYDGTKCRTQEAMENGRRTIIAEFQNTVSRLLEQRTIKVHRLEDVQLETEGFCSQTTARLKLAQAHQGREIAKLHEQIELAKAGRGWVLEALNRYEQGFRLGLKSAIEFELLS